MEIVSVSVSGSKEKDREKEKIDDRPAKLNEKKSEGELEREKFRLVHQMEPTISVWSDRNVRDQL